MIEAVRTAWAGIPTPPAQDMQNVALACGEEGSRALVGVAPLDVDIRSAGFLACTPLLDLPPAAAAAYLGAYLLSLLHGLSLQEQTGLFHDIVTRAHVLSCLGMEDFWRTVIRPHLPAECRQVLVDLSHYLVARRELLGLSAEEADRIVALATAN
jgi:hypothetical protein